MEDFDFGLLGFLIFMLIICVASHTIMLRGMFMGNHRWFAKFAITCISINYLLMAIIFVVQFCIQGTHRSIYGIKYATIFAKLQAFFGFEAIFLQILVHAERLLSILVTNMKRTTLSMLASIFAVLATIMASIGCVIAIAYHRVYFLHLPFPFNNFTFALNMVSLSFELIILLITSYLVKNLRRKPTIVPGLIHASTVDFLFRFVIIILSTFQQFFIDAGIARNPEKFQFFLNILWIVGGIYVAWILVASNLEDHVKGMERRTAKVYFTDLPIRMLEHFNYLRCVAWAQQPNPYIR